jgi:hypothetical protein
MPPPETTKASYLSAHQQHPIVAVIPYCDTSQCAFPTPEGLFIKLYRLLNNRTLRTANWLCVHIDCIIWVSFGPSWMVLTWDLFQAAASSAVVSCQAPCRYPFVLLSPYHAIRESYQSGTSRTSSNLAEERFRSMTRVAGQAPSKCHPTQLPVSPYLLGSQLGSVSSHHSREASWAFPRRLFPRPSRPSLGTVAVTKFNA